MAHKKRKSKYTSFIMVRENQQAPWNIRIRTGLLKFLSALGIALLVLIVLGFATYWKVAEVALDNNRLKEENFKLQKSLDQMDKIKEELAVIKGFEKQLKGSLSGYVTIEQGNANDSLDISDFDFGKLNVEKRRTFFRNIPSMQPAEGFMSRGYDASSLISDPHLGVDISAPTGTPVKAPADGIVLFSDWTIDGGNVLIIEHGFGFITLYKHNERNLVKRLEKITQGQTIALVGNTGKISSGPHLHYEIWQNGRPLDPVNYLNFDETNNS